MTETAMNDTTEIKPDPKTQRLTSLRDQLKQLRHPLPLGASNQDRTARAYECETLLKQIIELEQS